MATFLYADRCRVYSTTTGTGTLTLGTAVTNFRTFAAAVTANALSSGLVWYVIEDGSNWEIGFGTYTNGVETLTRNVTQTSAGNTTAITCSGNQQVYIAATAGSLVGDQTFTSASFGSTTSVKLNLFSTTYGVAINSNELCLFVPTGAQLTLRGTNVSGTIYFSATSTGINSTAIGATTASTGAFTTLTSSSTTTIGGNTGSPSLYLNGAAGQGRNIWFETAGSLRWVIYANSTAESGSNVGSDLAIGCYTDTATALNTPLTITRSTGLVTLSSGLTVNTGATTVAALTASGTTTLGALVFNSGAVSGTASTWSVTSGDAVNGFGFLSQSIAAETGAPVTLYTNASTTASNVLNFAATTGVATGMNALCGNTGYSNVVTAVTSTTVTITNNVTIASGTQVNFAFVSMGPRFYASNGNGSSLLHLDWRNASGNSWSQASKRIQMQTDSTSQGFIEFNPVGYSGGLALGVGYIGPSPSYAISISSGNIAQVVTAALGTSTLQIASTAFVINQAATATPQALGTAAVGTSTTYARADHVHTAPTRNSLDTGSVALTYASTITPSLSSGNMFTVTLTGNVTFANPTGIQPGGHYQFTITQDSTGSRTISFGTVWKWANKTAPTLTTAAGAVDVITAFSPDGTNLYGILTANFG